MNGAGAQRAIVQTYYDKEGRDTAVATSSAPDSAGIDSSVTRYRFDAAGRKLVEIFPNTSVDSLMYDAAGNDTLTVTRRGKHVWQHFDLLNRLAGCGKRCG